jgi:hypothetical protein
VASDFRQCETIKPDGERCRGRALPGRPHCTFHDSTTRRAQAEGRRAGGRRRCKPPATLSPDEPDAPLSTVAEATSFLARVANATAKGVMDPRVTNATVYAVSALVNGLLNGDIETRLTAIEARLAAAGDGR